MYNKKKPNFRKGRRLRVIACIQARMGSTRLKGKVLRKILGRTVIRHIFTRLEVAREIDDIILSTSSRKENDVLVEEAKDIGLKYYRYRGDENDIVARLYWTAKKFKADAVVHVNADCPLVDPGLLDKMVRLYRRRYKELDFVTNNLHPTFPHGLDAEIFSFATLKESFNGLKKGDIHREWLTPYVMQNPKKFRTYSFKNPINLSSLRWTLDYPEDLKLIRAIYAELYKENNVFTISDILNLLKQKPRLLKINAKRIDRVIRNGIRSKAYFSLIKKINKSYKVK